jgi:hypothetical protein
MPIFAEKLAKPQPGFGAFRRRSTNASTGMTNIFPTEEQIG